MLCRISTRVGVEPVDEGYPSTSLSPDFLFFVIMYPILSILWCGVSLILQYNWIRNCILFSFLGSLSPAPSAFFCGQFQLFLPAAQHKHIIYYYGCWFLHMWIVLSVLLYKSHQMVSYCASLFCSWPIFFMAPATVSIFISNIDYLVWS